MLEDLRHREVNYDPAAAPFEGHIEGHWHVDAGETFIGREPPGSPVPDGVFARACHLVSCYEFSDPRIVQAVYRADDELLGRDMLLEGRFYGMRFYFGVRVSAVHDERRDSGSRAEQLWGWSYQTLRGHLEQGELAYQVIKNLDSGEVRFRVVGYSRMAPIGNPVVRMGFLLFGRRIQRRFYRRIQQRMRTLTDPMQGRPLPARTMLPGGLVLAPSVARMSLLERLAAAVPHPGR
jgi:uncharacterized protein (UPF0548 family)